MLRNLINGLLELVYPKTCITCKKSLKGIPNKDIYICAECRTDIKMNLPPFCFFCGRHLDNSSFNKSICRACIKRTPHFDRAFSPCAYEGIIKELIREFKYNRKDYLGRYLSSFMIDFIKEYDVPMEYLDYIIPMPLHTARLRDREFNQAEILSDSIAEHFRKKILNHQLIRQRNTKTQTELEEKDRFLNVRGCFSLKNKGLIKDKNILLVDDVLTTAATSSEAARVLKDAGANIVFVLTLAN